VCTSEGARQVVDLIVDRLRRGTTGFGNHQARPCGRYDPLTHAEFIADLLALDPVKRILRYVTGGPVADPSDALAEINPAQEAALRAIIERADRWGALARAGPDLPPDCLDEINARLTSWSERQLPYYCRRRLRGPAALAVLIEALRTAFFARLATYQYEEDPFVWAKLTVLRALRQQIDPCVCVMRPDLVRPDLYAILLDEATAVLAALEGTLGISDIDPADIAEHVWWRLARAPTAEYTAYLAQPGQLEAWARSLVRDEIKLRAASRWRPDFLFDWGVP
jgi:hypothetical protein